MGVASLGKDHTWEINLAARAAWMSYVGDMTQSEIAKRLGVSSARVHRLIQLARQHGIVRVSVEGRPAECMHLEAEIAARHGLKSCTISPFLSDRDDRDELAALSVGQAAGQVIAQHLLLPSTGSMAIDPFGAIVREAMRSVPQFSKPELKVWPTHGCLAWDFKSVSSEVLSLLESRTRAEIGVLPAPYAPGAVEEFDSFMALASIQRALQSAAGADLLVGQVHAAAAIDAVTPKSLADRMVRSGAVARFLGNYFVADGSRLVQEGANRVLSLDTTRLAARVETDGVRVFALAAGPELLQSCLAILAKGMVTDLVLDEPLAVALGGSRTDPR